MDYATGMLALCAGLLNLTVASVISLTGPPSGDLPLCVLILVCWFSARPLHRSSLLFG